MKKLLLAISLSILFCFVLCCHSIKTSEQDKSIEKKVVSTDSAYSSDTTKDRIKINTSGTVGIGHGICKDSNKNYKGGNEIIHHAPNQGKIDSIKNSKNK